MPTTDRPTLRARLAPALAAVLAVAAFVAPPAFGATEAQQGGQLLQRLQAEQPGTFPDGMLRTMGRRVREWRVAAAKRLVFGAGAEAAGSHELAIDSIAAGLSRANLKRQAGS